jgi:hypothetical protein
MKLKYYEDDQCLSLGSYGKNFKFISYFTVFVTYYTYHVLHLILLKIRKLENSKFLTEKFSEFLDLSLNKSMPIQNP